MKKYFALFLTVAVVSTAFATIPAVPATSAVSAPSVSASASISTMTSALASAARQAAVTGRVVDSLGTAVPYATVVMLRGGKQVAGTSTDDGGAFALQIAAGEYTMTVQYVGFQPLTREVNLVGGDDLGDIVLQNASTKIEDVVVEAKLIRREADRFVVDVANSPQAIGKDGVELLESSPGVWVTDDEISINGKSGSKVYVNDRELKMNTEQLLHYLRSLRAEDIQKIEVVPIVGADFDADTSAGAIMITLRKRREDGFDGNLSFNAQTSVCRNIYSPNASFNYHSDRFDLFASAWGYFSPQDETRTTEHTVYETTHNELLSQSRLMSKTPMGGGRVGGVWEVNKRHSIGAEVSGMVNDDSVENTSSTDMVGATRQLNHSRYLTPYNTYKNITVTANYIWKTDTLGSLFKLIADHTHSLSGSRHRGDTHSEYFDPADAASPFADRDSLYADRSANRYDITTAQLSWQKVFTPKWTFTVGAKYTRNQTRNEARYTWKEGELWHGYEGGLHDYDVGYVETIGALYTTVRGAFGGWNLSAGLRGEYTHTSGREGSEVKQNYFSLFPNANIQRSFDKAGKHSFVLAYSRKIRRPGFWALTPTRMQISDFTYQIGNPDLRPSYNNDLSLTLIFNYKYSISLGMNIITDAYEQVLLQDPDDPRVLCLTQTNFPTYNNYYATVNLPVNLAKWWSWNINLTGIRQGQQVDPASPVVYHNMMMAYSMMTFTLPAKFFFDLSFWGRTKVWSGTTSIDGKYSLSVTLKKRLLKDRLTLTAGVNNLIRRTENFTAYGDGFVRDIKLRNHWTEPQYRVGISWNFQGGKQFRQRTVESGSAEEQSRLGGGGNGN